ncbi:MAG: helix-turn-helix transcriptional regulator [Thiotrichaceae bacterium]|nr:helix-turn-helix transcriptional regulator [Thiotrichaceae bacterium]
MKNIDNKASFIKEEEDSGKLSSYLFARAKNPLTQDPLNSPITPREKHCLSCASMGNTSKEIGLELNISEHTVNFHVKNSIRKLHAKNKTHAVAIAVRFGYINVDHFEKNWT